MDARWTHDGQASADIRVEKTVQPLANERRFDDSWVLRPTESFVDDCVRIITPIAKIGRQFERHVFVQFELHDTRIGISRSSCANSAVYANAA